MRGLNFRQIRTDPNLACERAAQSDYIDQTPGLPPAETRTGPCLDVGGGRIQ